MATFSWESYPPETPEDQLEYLVQQVKDWTVCHGLVVRPNPAFISDNVNPAHVAATNAPVTLFPSPFPSNCFRLAQSLQKLYNELYAAIASDEEWLGGVMQEYVSCLFLGLMQDKSEHGLIDISDYLK